MASRWIQVDQTGSEGRESLLVEVSLPPLVQRSSGHETDSGHKAIRGSLNQ